MEFEVIPAIDLLDGECVRLVKGKSKAKTIYRKDAAQLAREFVASGAKTIHVVDLNAALESGSNAALIEKIVSAVRGKARVQVGGGVRSAAMAKKLFSLGVKRVIVGTAAFASELKKITVLGETLAAIDYASGKIKMMGWKQTAAKLTNRVLLNLEENGVAGFLATDVERDGTLQGARTKTLREIVKATRLPVYAAGGVATLEDVREIARAGAAGVVVGKALYEKRFTLEEALEVAAQC